MNRVWRYIWPDVVTDFHSFDPEEIGKPRCAITDMVKTVGFEDADQVNVEELFQSHTEELSNENLLELKNELNDEEGESSDVKSVKHLSTKQLTEFCKHINSATGITDNNDATMDRSVIPE
jgi:hypothetical protein